MSQERYNRQMRFFTKEGQDKLSMIKVVIVGVGGLGSHIIQQMAFLGVGNIIVIDQDTPDITSLNRLIGSHHDEHLSGLTKVRIMKEWCKKLIPQPRSQELKRA